MVLRNLVWLHGADQTCHQHPPFTYSVDQVAHAHTYTHTHTHIHLYINILIYMYISIYTHIQICIDIYKIDRAPSAQPMQHTDARGMQWWSSKELCYGGLHVAIAGPES